MVNARRTLYSAVGRRQTSFFGNIIRRDASENTATSGKINDQIGRGIPR